MNLSDYIQLPKEQRIAHIDLTQPCFLSYAKGRAGTRSARRNLTELLQITNERLGCKVHCCHLCPNNSAADGVCINPAHLYLGTAKENAQDKPSDVRSEAVRNGHSDDPETRTARGKKAWAGKSQEERSAVAHKAWETRRRNQQGG